MRSPIPILNVYFLLSYAWKHLNEGEVRPLGATEGEQLEDLFSLILARGIGRLVRRGLDRGYLAEVEETPRLRGRIDFAASIPRQTWRHGRMVCQFDELSPDVLQNQLLKATGARLLGCGLSRGPRAELRDALGWLREVSEIRPHSRHFQSVRPNRGNGREYRFLLSVCQLALDSLLPGEGTGSGKIRNFLEEESTMSALFEDFVRNFFHHHSEFQVAAPQIKWCGYAINDDSKAVLPVMKTDVVLSSPDHRIILDCKFYKEAIKGSQFGNPRIRPAHLYQIFAYLKNQAASDPDWEDAEGILLYPSVEKSFDHRFVLHGQSIRFVSIDLHQPWQGIHRDLLAIVRRG